jgi:hypothetical protein
MAGLQSASHNGAPIGGVTSSLKVAIDRRGAAAKVSTLTHRATMAASNDFMICPDEVSTTAARRLAVRYVTIASEALP